MSFENPQKRYCLQCGAEVLPGANFCSVCAAPVRASGTRTGAFPPVDQDETAVMPPVAATDQENAAQAVADLDDTSFFEEEDQRPLAPRPALYNKPTVRKANKRPVVWIVVLIICLLFALGAAGLFVYNTYNLYNNEPQVSSTPQAQKSADSASKEAADKALKEAKEKAEGSIGALENLSDEEKAEFTTKVEKATSAAAVQRVVQEAEQKDTAAKKAAEEEAKAAETIGSEAASGAAGQASGSASSATASANVLASLQASYDSCAGFDKRISARAYDFNINCLKPNLATRQSYASKAQALRSEIANFKAQVNGLAVASSSPYYTDWTNMCALAADLYQRIDVICRCWDISVSYGSNPAPYRAQIMQPLYDEVGPDGKNNKYKLHYDSLYPKARPQAR